MSKLETVNSLPGSVVSIAQAAKNLQEIVAYLKEDLKTLPDAIPDEVMDMLEAAKDLQMDLFQVRRAVEKLPADLVKVIAEVKRAEKTIVEYKRCLATQEGLFYRRMNLNDRKARAVAFLIGLLLAGVFMLGYLWHGTFSLSAKMQAGARISKAEAWDRLYREQDVELKRYMNKILEQARNYTRNE